MFCGSHNGVAEDQFSGMLCSGGRYTDIDISEVHSPSATSPLLLHVTSVTVYQ